MKIDLFYNGRKNSNYSASHKRVKLYYKGFQELNCDARLLYLFSIKNSNKFKFLLGFFLNPFLKILFVFFSLRKKSVWFIYDNNWLTILIFTFLSKIFQSKIVLEVNEKYDSIKVHKLSKFIILFSNFMLNQIAYKVVDGFVVISDSLFIFISITCQKKSKIIKIPIIVDPFEFININIPFNSNKILNPYFIHSGSLSDQKDGIVDVFNAFGLFHSLYSIPLHFYLTTRITDKVTMSKIKAIIKKYNLFSYIHWLENISENELMFYQKHSKFFIINKKSNYQNQFNFSTKLGEYICSGNPIITTGFGEIGKYIINNENGYIYEEGNNFELASIMYYIITNSNLQISITSKAMLLAHKEFNYLKNSIFLKSFFNKLINE